MSKQEIVSDDWVDKVGWIFYYVRNTGWYTTCHYTSDEIFVLKNLKLKK